MVGNTLVQDADTTALQRAVEATVAGIIPSSEIAANVLQPSSLRAYRWPETDPLTVNQTTRPMSAADVALVQACARAESINFEAFEKEQRKKNSTVAQKVHSILTHEKFQMNPVGALRGERRWQERIEWAVDRGEPILILFPQLCRIPNWAKQMTNTGPTAGEDCHILSVLHLNDQIKQVYPPGIRVIDLCDASLYASAYQTNHAEVTAYVDGVRERVKALDADRVLAIQDYAELLSRECGKEYRAAYLHFNEQMWAGDEGSVLGSTNSIETLKHSVHASVNTLRIGMTYRDHRDIFGPDREAATQNPFNTLVEQMSAIAFKEVMAIRKACEEVNITARIWPRGLRASCHKGQKNGTWPIGLRPYPEYYRSSKLLPYHGVPLVYLCGKGKPKLAIHPEFLLRGNRDLVRVVKADGTEIYFYDGTHLPPGSLSRLWA